MEPQKPPESVEQMSFIDKLTNIFASPGELFENVRETGPTNSNWLVPWITYVAISIMMSLLVLGNPSLKEQLSTSIKKQFDKGMEEMIREGKISQEQADAQYEQFGRPGSPWFMIISVASTLLGSLVVLFALSLFYQLLGKLVMSASVHYMKVVEVIGLTFFIGALERIVTTGLIFATDSIHASPSLAIVLSEVDPENKLHVVMSKINVFTAWDLTITGIGLSTLFQRDLPKVLVLIVALWIIWSAFSVFTGFSFGG